MLPFMKSKNSTSVYNITSFGGLNPSYSRKLNEMPEGLNICSDMYPALSTYKAPETIRHLTRRVLGGAYYNRLYTIEQDDSGKIFLCTDSKETDISNLSTEVSDSGSDITSKPRTLEFMKDEALIIPDNVIYHTNTNTAQAGCISEKFTSSSAQEKFEIQSKTTSKMPMPYNIWYSSYLTSNSIVSMSGTYRQSSSSYKYYHMGITGDFSAGDVVTVKMSVKPIDVEHNDAYKAYIQKMSDGVSLKIKELVKTTHSTPNGSVSEYTEIIFEDNSLDLGGYNEILVVDMSIEKGIPNFIDICSFENRMWGVTENKIHASKLGDSSEWNDFTVDNYGTLPSSCFATEVETDGSFTAIYAYNGNVLAFKEDCIHKIYGSEPEEFSVVRIDCPGVQKDSKNTLASIGGTLYYMGTDGVYAYNGSIPRLISKNIFDADTCANYAGSDNRYYYIDVKRDDGNSIYVYDTLYSIWHKTDSAENIVSFIKSPDSQYIATANSVMEMHRNPPQNWNFVFNLWSKEFNSKHLCGLRVRYSLESGGKSNIYLLNRHKKYKLAEINKSAENSTLQLRLPVSCDRDAQLIFEGCGGFVLNSLEIRYKETGID